MSKICPLCAHHYTVRVNMRCPNCKVQVFYPGEEMDIDPGATQALVFDRIALLWTLVPHRPHEGRPHG